jgi:S1-C subfamily serine protease
MKEFKIIVPGAQDADDEELEATFVGRDERSEIAFVKAGSPAGATTSPATQPAPTLARTWQAVHFKTAPILVGDTVLSVGLLPKAAGYRGYFAEATVAALLRGETKQVLVSSGGLTAIGSPVFNTEGTAIGFVNVQMEQSPFLNDPRSPMGSVQSPPKFFVPAADFLPSLEDPPVAGQPLNLSWVGLPQLAGLSKDVAEFFGLKGQPAVEVGDVLANSAAEKAGMRRGQIIVKVDGHFLERGDAPDEAAQILRRQLLRKKVGTSVTFAVLERPGAPLKDITVTTELRPKGANLAARFYADDLGFSAREMVFADTYMRRLPADSKGVVISWVKPQGSAQNSHMEGNDLVTEMNNTPVTDINQFRKAYQEFRKLRPNDAVVMVVLRDGNTEVIRIEPPQ